MRQEVLHPELTEANQIMLEELNNGVTSVELKLDAAASAGLDPDDSRSVELCGRDGVTVYSLGDLDQALKGVQLDVVLVSLEGGASSCRLRPCSPLWWRKGASKVRRSWAPSTRTRWVR